MLTKIHTCVLAGAPGLEPGPSVLETDMLAINTMPPRISRSAISVSYQQRWEKGAPNLALQIRPYAIPVRWLSRFSKNLTADLPPITHFTSR